MLILAEHGDNDALQTAAKHASVCVTRRHEEAPELADRVVMNKGDIEQVGSPSEVRHASAAACVCEFLGDVNRLEAMVAGVMER